MTTDRTTYQLAFVGGPRDGFATEYPTISIAGYCAIPGTVRLDDVGVNAGPESPHKYVLKANTPNDKGYFVYEHVSEDAELLA